MSQIAGLVLGRNKRITTLVGGINNMVAAIELEQFGHRVTLFEALPRLGSHIHTNRLADDNQAAGSGGVKYVR